MLNSCKKYAFRFVLLVVALQILNMSVTCRITDDSFFSQIDNSVNIADHAVEFIAENILGFTNAFPEVKEGRQQHHVSNTQKTPDFKLFSYKPKPEVPVCTTQACNSYSLLIIQPYCEYLWEVTPPPPKVA